MNERRTIAGQLEFRAKLRQAVFDNPDLPISFIAGSLVSMAEPRESAPPFVSRVSETPSPYQKTK
jgi:hypothetical protein